jgi:biopolymer transport protein ExbD
MKFPRNSKILRSQFDVAPFAAVFFALMILLMLGGLLPVGGLRMGLQPPAAGDLPGVDKPTVAMAIDAQGRLYFENQIVSEPVLKTLLAAKTMAARAPLTLVIHADKAVSYEQLAHLAAVVRRPEIGITNLLLATLPREAGARAQP